MESLTYLLTYTGSSLETVQHGPPHCNKVETCVMGFLVDFFRAPRCRRARGNSLSSSTSSPPYWHTDTQIVTHTHTHTYGPHTDWHTQRWTTHRLTYTHIWTTHRLTHTQMDHTQTDIHTNGPHTDWHLPGLTTFCQQRSKSQFKPCQQQKRVSVKVFFSKTY